MSSDVVDDSVADAAVVPVRLPTFADFCSLSGYRRDEAYLRVEREVRRLQALQAAMLAEVESSLSYLDDRHHTAGAWVTAVANCDKRTGNARVRTAKMLALLPVVAAANAAGEIGVDQLRELSRLYANPRAREHMVAAQDTFVEMARYTTALDFEQHCQRWLRAADPDGTHKDHEICRENRRVTYNRIGAGFEMRVEGDAMTGEMFFEIWQRHIEAELETDLAERRSLYGDQADRYPLARTNLQRGYDAFIAMGLKAVGTSKATDREPLVVIHCTEQDLEDALALLLTGEVPAPDDRSLRKRLCETSSGAQVDLIDLALAALIGKVQRIVTAKDGHVIDLGRRKRLFTGAVRDAVLLAGDRCFWPGCLWRSGRMQVDHTREWVRHFGVTASWNGGAGCGGHNWAKHAGQYTVERDEYGWHLYRPDGTEVAQREPH
ncbi:MAG: hypothetical protein JWM34_3625 [Ilumatobacteraceae bacterium]|nr:hypothetical protein [Ilumatobacteraceae bacterium]